MAFIQCNYYAKSIFRMHSFIAFLPTDYRWQPEVEVVDGAPLKTLYLMNGIRGDQTDWLLYSNIADIANRYNMAVILPAGDNRFALDNENMGEYYCKLIGEELLQYTRSIFPLSTKREDTFIGGLSMGGYSAVHIGMTYPETFSKIVSLSGAFIVVGMADGTMKDPLGSRYLGSDYENMSKDSRDPRWQIAELKKEGKEIPSIYQAIGTEDSLLEVNRTFRKFVEESGIDAEYVEDKGIHDWKFWNKYIEEAAKWLYRC